MNLVSPISELVTDALEHTGLEKFSDAETTRAALVDTMVHTVGRDPMVAKPQDWFYTLAYLVRGVMAARSIEVARALREAESRRVYYLSMEYLTGRSLTKQLIDLGVEDVAREALAACGQDYETIKLCESDAALGNGGLGRLAACFMESLATHRYPGFGYGTRFEFGMFDQQIQDGQQIELPENWLRHGNPWEIERPEVFYTVRFHGRVNRFRAPSGVEVSEWVDTDEVVALAFDAPVSGYRSKATTNLRLWSARSTRDLNLVSFNEGQLQAAVAEKTISESLTKVLYPNDSTPTGQELRLKQEYFFVSASVQDILRRFKDQFDDLSRLPEKVVIQLNDTHPALAIPELMRLLIDEHELSWDAARDIVSKVFCYTNHTLLPEALETWPIALLERVLPRHLEIIFDINLEFLEQVRRKFPGNPAVLARLSLVDDSGRSIRMAHLAMVASSKVNGVAELHTRLLRSTVFHDFHQMWPDKLINVTNGITPRRWLLQANPRLSALITEAIGDGWVRDLEKLKDLEALAGDHGFQDRFGEIKQANKERVSAMSSLCLETPLDTETLFDVQVKRIHEYKRQLLNAMHVIELYNRMRGDGGDEIEPRTVIIGGKAASSYFMAKLIIRFINDIAKIINRDPAVGDRLKVVFVPNYNVSVAEILIPGADLSEQISTAGTEASGTGNMKLALNGALTIGTLDGANIEIRDAVGEDNIFIFGMTADQVQDARHGGYVPWRLYHADPALRQVLDMIGEGFFTPEQPDRYKGLFEALLPGGDHYMLLADFRSYVDTQNKVAKLYRNRRRWLKKAIINVANMGRFSSDRTIRAYARDVWQVEPESV